MVIFGEWQYISMPLMNRFRKFRKTVNRLWRRWKLRRDLRSKEAGDEVADLFDRAEEEVGSSDEFERMLSESDSLRELEERLDEE